MFIFHQLKYYRHLKMDIALELYTGMHNHNEKHAWSPAQTLLYLFLHTFFQFGASRVINQYQIS